MAIFTEDEIRQAGLRASLVEALLLMIKFIEKATPILPSYGPSMGLYVYAKDVAEARSIMRRSPGGWEKFTSKTASYTEYTKTFRSQGEGTASDSHAFYTICVNKNESCERVQVGTRHVKGQYTKAYDEPIYEWKCEDE